LEPQNVEIVTLAALTVVQLQIIVSAPVIQDTLTKRDFQDNAPKIVSQINTLVAILALIAMILVMDAQDQLVQTAIIATLLVDTSLVQGPV
jgi:hypothetical protein